MFLTGFNGIHRNVRLLLFASSLAVRVCTHQRAIVRLGKELRAIFSSLHDNCSLLVSIRGFNHGKFVKMYQIVFTSR